MKRCLRQFVVRHYCKVIHIVAESSADHTVRLEFLHQTVEFAALFRAERAHIEPEFGYGAVAREELAHLCLVEFVMLWSHKIRIVAGYRIGIWKMPVDQ